MARSVVLSNGQLCVALDDNAEVRDVYFPYVGHEDHVRGHYIHRLGVWVDGVMSWFSDGSWNIDVICETDALASAVVARNEKLAVELIFKDIVYNEKPVFIRRVSIKNTSDRVREIKLYFGHQFEISKTHGSDTAYFDPFTNSIIHYKGRRVFLMGAQLDGVPFQDYAPGRSNFQGKEGTHRDADDGQLSKNPIEHGPADSVLGLYGSYAPQQSRTAYYWLCAAESIPEAQGLNAYIQRKSPEHMIKTTSNYWHAWLSVCQRNFTGLLPEHAALYKRSLLFVKAHVDHGGGILASLDSDMLGFALDTYAYVWPRDAAINAMALEKAGDNNDSKRFFQFCRDVITDEGYLLHKYLPDKALGSSWHPWIKDGKVQLPIQEDETAIVLYAFYEHYKKTHDLEFLEEMFTPLIEKAANFLVKYRDADTRLPLASYDLWERKRGCSTFTASSVYAGLIAAAALSHILGKDSHEDRYRIAAEEVRTAIVKHLWDEKLGTFVNLSVGVGADLEFDTTIDISSVYGVFVFGVLPPNDPKVVRGFEVSVAALSHGIGCGGIARFIDDDYFRIDRVSPGNPWVITTLWYAEYLIATAKKASDLKRVRDIFSWVHKHARPSGALSEQLHPQTGEQVGATPLAWSHAAYVLTVIQYMEKSKELGV